MAGWLIVENPVDIDELAVPPFQETTIPELEIIVTYPESSCAYLVNECAKARCQLV